MIIKFTIPYPENHTRWNKSFGLNAIYAGKHWTKRKQDSEYWHYLVRSEMRKQKIKKQLCSNPVKIIFYHNDRMDIDNHAYIEKMIVDSLKGYLIEDDNRKHYVEKISRFHDFNYIAIEIYEVEK